MKRTNRNTKSRGYLYFFLCFVCLVVLVQYAAKKTNASGLEKQLFLDEGGDSEPPQSALVPEIPAQGPGSEPGGVIAVDILPIAPASFHGDVRHLPQVPHKKGERPELGQPYDFKQLLPEANGPQKLEPNIPLAPMPGTIQNFAGLSFSDPVTGGQAGAGWPPDTNGDVGPNHYIQAVNDAYAIYGKTGTLLASFTENSLFSGGPTGTVCDTSSFGDPVVIYDPMADRWILTNFAFNLVSGIWVSPIYQCLAVSKTSDPVTGGWYLYPIRIDTGVAGQPPVGTLNDYGKFGIWTDCLYYAANGFSGTTGAYTGGVLGSFSRSDMYAGLPLTGALGFAASTSDFFTMLPSNISGPAGALPPAGTPNYYVQESLTAFNFRVRTFTAGTNCGGGGVLSGATTVSQTSYTIPGSNIVPQPAPATSTNNLDSLGDRLMQKNQYRRVGSAESLWVNHTFRSSSSGPTGLQWAQIDVTGTTIGTTPVQQQLYNPGDGIYRWMGSIAADKDGNVALGYSTSNATSPNFPSIAYSGRLAGDAANMLPQTETQIIAGSGSQINNCGGAPCHRWGDYSSMSVDPDGCTFWFTTEYYSSQANGTSGNWNTRIGSFKFPSCTPGTPTPTPPPATATPPNTNTPTPTNTNTPTPTAGPSADLSVVKSDSPDPVSVGSNLTYTVAVTNNGPDSTANVRMTDRLPAGVTFVSATATQGSCTQSAGKVSCTLGTLANGGSAKATIIVRPTAVGSIRNSASVTGSVADPNTANNRSRAQTTVN